MPTDKNEIFKNREGGSINIRTRKRRERIQDPATLLQNLKNVEGDDSQISNEITNTRMVPYKIPAIYSLRSEEKILCRMEKRLGLIKEELFTTDIESISSDWNRVGGDISNVLNRYQ